MAKRSDFKRNARDAYDTPEALVRPLLPHLAGSGSGRFRFVEPCAGSGALINHLTAAGHICAAAFDIAPRRGDIRQLDMLKMTSDDCGVLRDCVITNPPWSRPLLHAFLLRLRELGMPAWLLLDSGWMFTQQAAPYLVYCSRIVAVGRATWIPGTKHESLDDCAWYLFQPHVPMGTMFFGRQPKERKHDSADKPEAGRRPAQGGAGVRGSRQASGGRRVSRLPVEA